MSAEAGGPQYGFDLAGGRRIQMLALDQWWTYDGLLAGRPSGHLNRHLLDRLAARYAGPDGGHTPLLLEPVPMSLEDPESRSFDGDSVVLPAATCAARFWSEKLAGDDHGVASMLRVIWFQDDFAFPIDHVVTVELEALDWEAHAWSWEP
jgi:hypothetical protein